MNILVALPGFAFHQASTNQQLWLDYLVSGASVFQDAVAAAAIIVGGFLAYMRLFAGRFLRIRLEPEISGELVREGGVLYLKVQGSTRNHSLRRAKLDSELTALVVDARKPHSEGWEAQVGLRLLQDVIPEIQRAALTKDGITPGSGSSWTRWVDIPDERYISIRLQFTVVTASRKHAWVAEDIVFVPQDEDDRVDQPLILSNELKAAFKRWWESK